jgi:hypothetical protein
MIGFYDKRTYLNEETTMKVPSKPYRWFAIETLAISLLFAVAGLAAQNFGAVVVAVAFVHLSLLFSWLEWRRPVTQDERLALVAALRRS